MSKKRYLLQWVDVQGISLDYAEVWSENELKKDFINYKSVLRFLKTSFKNESFVHIFEDSNDNNDGMVILTRIK